VNKLLAVVTCALLLVGCGDGGSGGSLGSSTSGSSSSGATSTYWVPFAESYFPDSGSHMPFGIFVVPSTAPGDNPVYVTYSDQSLNLGYGNGTSLNASKVVTDYSPATFLYAALDASDNAHIYSLDLTSSVIPVPVQVSNLSMPIGSLNLNQWICDSQSGFGNVLQPTTLFVVLHIAGSAGCNTSGDTWKVVHYTDSATTAPVDVSITSSRFTPLYAPSGALASLLLLDPVSHNLYDYADSTFTSPVAAIAGGDISAVNSLYASGVTGAQTFTGTTLFLTVTINGSEQLYRISYGSTTAALVYTASGTLDSNAVYDDNNLYFDDVLTGTSGTVQSVWQVALAGGAPLELYSATVPANSSPLGLVGANDSVLVVLSEGALSGTVFGALQTLAVGVVNGTPQPLGPSNQVASAWMWPTTAGMPASDLIFADIFGDPSNDGSFATEIFGTDGSVRRALVANSQFLPNATSPQSGVILERAGLEPEDSGGTIQAINLSTLAATTVFSGLYGGSCCDFTLSGLSSGVVAGGMHAYAPVEPQGLLIDLSSDVAVLFGTNVYPVTLF
jgi:hypothetical protein